MYHSSKALSRIAAQYAEFEMAWQVGHDNTAAYIVTYSLTEIFQSKLQNGHFGTFSVH